MKLATQASHSWRCRDVCAWKKTLSIISSSRLLTIYTKRIANFVAHLSSTLMMKMISLNMIVFQSQAVGVKTVEETHLAERERLMPE